MCSVPVIFFPKDQFPLLSFNQFVSAFLMLPGISLLLFFGFSLIVLMEVVLVMLVRMGVGEPFMPVPVYFPVEEEHS